MNTFGDFILTVIGMVGMFFTISYAILVGSAYLNNKEKLIDCEQLLPRNEICIMVAVPENKLGENK